jgi:hypothetical protein
MLRLVGRLDYVKVDVDGEIVEIAWDDRQLLDDRPRKADDTDLVCVEIVSVFVGGTDLIRCELRRSAADLRSERGSSDARC